MISCVPELAFHIGPREALLDLSFGPFRHAKTSERLREGRLPAADLSFAAFDGRTLVGTVRLWSVEAGPGRPALLLGPLAAHPAARGAGVGTRLMAHSLAAAAVRGHSAVLLVGDAPYYERFGFTADLTGGLALPGPYERNRFLGLELVCGALEGASGLVTATGEPIPAAARRAA